MSFLHSRSATLLAVAATLTLTATPALAQPGPPPPGPYWHHHHHGGSGAGVLAALLIGGGIGAIAATAANNSNKTPPPSSSPAYSYDAPPPVSAPAQGVPAYPGGPLPGDDDRPVYVPPQTDGAGFAPAAPYPGPDRVQPSGAVHDANADIGFDGAVGSCSAEIDRDGQSIGNVDNVGRAGGDGYHVEGRTHDGRDFTCAMDSDGRIRSVTVDGHELD